VTARRLALALGAIEIITGLLQGAVPGWFYDEVSPILERNDYLMRDVATIHLAFGLALFALRDRPAWRLGVLICAAAQYALHALNHLFYVDDANPAWHGVFDFLYVGAFALIYAWLARRTEREGLT